MSLCMKPTASKDSSTMIPDNILILNEILRNEYRFSSTNGKQGLEIAARESDIILLDIIMPGMDGYEGMPKAQGR